MSSTPVTSKAELRRPDAFVKDLQRTFSNAVDAASLVRHRFRLADAVVDLQFAGEAFPPTFLQALDHARDEGDDLPDVTVFIWDSDTTQTAMPPPPWSLNAYGVRGEIQGFNSARYRTTYNVDADILNVCDVEAGHAFYWIRSAKSMPHYETAAPLRAILHWGLSGAERQVVHAGAVGYGGKGVLLSGKSGSGKSSTALSCLLHGFDYAGDDYCVVSTGATPAVHCMYTTAKLNPDNLRRFPALADKIHSFARHGPEKVLFFVQDHFEERVTSQLPLSALLVPVVRGASRTSLEAISPATALASLAPSTIFQMPGAGQETFTALSALVRKIPGFRLNLGTEPEEVASAIAAFLVRC